jgi:hypothetical protein
VLDSLGLPETKSTLVELNAVRKRFALEEIHPQPEIVRKLDENGLATWTWWLRQLVQHTRVGESRTREPYPLARVLEGDIDYEPPGDPLVFAEEPLPPYSKKRRDGFPRTLSEIEHFYSGADEEAD